MAFNQPFSVDPVIFFFLYVRKLVLRQPGVAEVGLHPGSPDFKAQAHNHYTTLPLEELQADEESPRRTNKAVRGCDSSECALVKRRLFLRK